MGKGVRRRKYACELLRFYDVRDRLDIPEIDRMAIWEEISRLIEAGLMHDEKKWKNRLGDKLNNLHRKAYGQDAENWPVERLPHRNTFGLKCINCSAIYRAENITEKEIDQAYIACTCGNNLSLKSDTGWFLHIDTK